MSANALADVAKLYCNIDLNKEIRGDFMTSSREAIHADIQDFLGYCAKDVYVTHQVFAQKSRGIYNNVRCFPHSYFSE